MKGMISMRALVLKNTETLEVMDVPLRSTGRATDAAGGGKIVNISSVHATDPKRNFAHYSSSKAGLEMLSKCMALELAARDIQANSIIVGAIGTEMTPPDRQAIVIPAVPAARIGTVEEIARFVAFLCSHSCDYMTGASIAVDGGLTTLGFCASRPEL